MSIRYRCLLLSAGSLVLAAVLVGCTHKAEQPEKPRPQVTIQKVEERPVTDVAQFTGRTDALEFVEVQARVTGHLARIDFTPGANVQGPVDPNKLAPSMVGLGASELPPFAASLLMVEGGTPTLLFQLDPELLEAEVVKAQGQVDLYKAQVERWNKEYERGKAIFGTGISPAEFDAIAGKKLEAEGSFKAAKANLESARINVRYTRITAPISGQISRPLVTVGNLVKADTTVLTTIVSTGRMYVYFDVDENSLLRLKAQIQAGTVKLAGVVPVEMRLPNEKGFTHKGQVDFVENRLNRSTGTLPVRAIFDDPKEMLQAGQFVQVRVRLGEPHPAPVIPQEAIGSDQGQNFVYVLDKDSKVHYRVIQLGPIQEDGAQVVRDGLKAGDTIVIDGLQRIRDDDLVDAKTPQK